MTRGQAICAQLGVCLALGCTETTVETITAGGHHEPLVYGQDDRHNLYEVEEAVAELARDNAVALIAGERLHQADGGHVAIVAPTWGEAQSLCPGERFSEEPAAASCSAVLLTETVVATAAHCLGITAEGLPDCTNNRYVMGYALSAPGATIELAPEDIFDCERVLSYPSPAADADCRVDVALVELDRPARPRAVIARRRLHPAVRGEPLRVIGSPAGLPLKIDDGARVVDPHSETGDYFTLDSDTFAVSSGSGVFDQHGELVGVLLRGRGDYEQQGDCQRVRYVVDAGAGGYEEAAHIAKVSALLDAITEHGSVTPYPSCTSQADVATMAADSGGRSEDSDARGGCSVAVATRRDRGPSAGETAGVVTALGFSAWRCSARRRRRTDAGRRAVARDTPQCV